MTRDCTQCTHQHREFDANGPCDRVSSIYFLKVQQIKLTMLRTTAAAEILSPKSIFSYSYGHENNFLN